MSSGVIRWGKPLVHSAGNNRPLAAALLDVLTIFIGPSSALVFHSFFFSLFLSLSVSSSQASCPQFSSNCALDVSCSQRKSPTSSLPSLYRSRLINEGNMRNLRGVRFGAD
ncbi:hypothetical protein ElyMa_000898200 [Elysia marginata]|uniref:Secreted protein n=1 Tax=Elysia marginata TaxID=1093978 RepID=A0AAV4H5W8_9GAST|nr:hypothetical protein ElyMa_000898200 [Elysia marginata]